MRAFMAVIGFVLGVTGCRVIVVGDSNSCMGFVPRQCDPRQWPGILQNRLDDVHAFWLVENYGMPGMTLAAAHEPDGTDKLHAALHKPVRASFHLDRMLAEEDLGRVCRFLPFAALAPRVVLAVGTNDVGVREARLVVEDLMALARRATAVVPCVQVYVATIPPRFDADFERKQGNMQRIEVNALIRRRFPADRVIDFDTGFTRDDTQADGVHISPRGQAKRAAVALRALFPALAG